MSRPLPVLTTPSELLSQWLVKRNLPLQPLRAGRLLSRWRELGAHAPLRGVPALPAAPIWLVFVMTYARPEACARVLQRVGAALAASGCQSRAGLVVFHDACGRDYERAHRVAAAAAGSSVWLDALERVGKQGFWQTYQLSMLIARACGAERALYLHDDLDFEPDLLERAEALWQATAEDPDRRVLYLYSSNDDEEGGRWTKFRRRDCPGKGCRQTNWLDLQAFMVDRTFFELMRYRVMPVHPNRWRRDPARSSGVGQQLTERCQGRASVYQAWPPLVAHGAEPSVANAEARYERQFDNRQEYERSLAERSKRAGEPG